VLPPGASLESCSHGTVRLAYEIDRAKGRNFILSFDGQVLITDGKDLREPGSQSRWHDGPLTSSSPRQSPRRVLRSLGQVVEEHPSVDSTWRMWTRSPETAVHRSFEARFGFVYPPVEPGFLVLVWIAADRAGMPRGPGLWRQGEEEDRNQGH